MAGRTTNKATEKKASGTNKKEAKTMAKAPAKKATTKKVTIKKEKVLPVERVIKVSWYAGKAQITKNQPRRTFEVTTCEKTAKEAEDVALDAIREIVGPDGVMVAEEIKE